MGGGVRRCGRNARARAPHVLRRTDLQARAADPAAPGSACPAGVTASCGLSCGTENPSRGTFCIECGTSLTARPRRAPAREEQLPEERRKATILFADLSGYTAVSERLDPERIKSMVDRALRRLGDEIERYGGTIDKYIGDNVMGVFGAPVAHEDDPERAVRAGLAMQAAMDGDQRAGRRRRRRQLRSRGSGSTRARCSPAGSATATR